MMGMTAPADNVPMAGQTMLDHVGLFVPDLSRAAAAFERLGFRLTPTTPQRHRLAPGQPLVPAGTANRLAVLGLGYVEILAPIADTPIAAQLKSAIERYPGLHLIAFGTADGEASHRHLAGAGFDPLPVIHLERTVETADGEGLALFSVVRVPPGTMAEGRVQYCRHHTPELVWQDRWQAQPNAATALTDVLLAVADPAEALGRFARFVGEGARVVDGSLPAIALPRGRLTLSDAQTLARLLPDVAVPSLPFMAAFAVTTHDLGRTRELLIAGRVNHRDLGAGALGAVLPEGLCGSVVFLEHGVTPPWWSH
jgi:catechol 2,3-dioxygenase-like lactoylglutathione lyase family enzyme